MSAAQHLILLPRAIRAQDAPAYLGIDRNKFNAEVKPKLTLVVLGHRIRCYDRLDLDRIWEEIKARNGRPGADDSLEEATSWENAQPGSAKRRTGHGSSTRLSSDSAFSNALDRAIAKSQKHT
ncbi:hypothetical protein [Aromatoleum buckelii]|uniref:hypothetical protein n=1 Tax=Aromatoleum buckelii TaxID=200254 RepID=UPI001B7D0844|nr:hypothetical protein [Aromatoleum buckelii]MCK0511556.1 hypothetical protein [Aromatoleum buckelii]